MRSVLATGALLALFASSIHAQEYRVKEEDARTGTSLKRDAAYGSIPYDKTWAQLSDEDKAQRRSMYENMGPNDEPPYPAKGYKALMRNVSKAGEAVQEQGIVDMGVIVGADGRATGVKVYGSPDPYLTRAVAGVLMLEKYKPALCNGQPCTQEFPFHTEFTLVH